MEQSADRPSQHLFGGTRLGNRQLGRLTKVGPALRPGVDVGEIQSSVVEITSQGGLVSGLDQSAKFLHLLVPLRRNGLTDAAQNDFRGDALQFHMATSRKEWEAVGYLLLDVFPGPTKERSQAPIESKLLPVVSDEVEYGADGLAGRSPETAPQLKKQGGAIGGSEHEQRVDGWHIDTFVEQMEMNLRLYQLPSQEISNAVGEIANTLNTYDGTYDNRDALLTVSQTAFEAFGEDHVINEIFAYFLDQTEEN